MLGAVQIERLCNPVQPYAWGSRRHIPELLGQPSPAAGPQAELWMGAHPLAPSRVRTPAGELPLDALIARDPEAALGPEVARRFGGALPFLFKLLAAAEPLSLQVHPSAAQARAGFLRENAAGIPFDDPKRCYRDPHAKPELICALTPFHALCGFRPLRELEAHIAELAAPELEPGARALAERGEAGLEAFFRGLWTLDPGVRGRVVARAQQRAGDRRGPHWQWVLRLAAAWPGDVGALAPLWLNLYELRPGQALYLDAGCLHSYLDGFAVELMANSDNVLRGGLTGKHVDLPALLDTLVFRCGAQAPLCGEPGAPGESRYRTPAREFELGALRPRPGAPCVAPRGHGVEILVCSDGEGKLVPEAGAQLPLRRGDSLFVPASAPGYRLEGALEVWRARVPA
jgi:mannose-6-phosphate isomerase